MSIEVILKRFGNAADIFDKEGNLTKLGNECYNDLIATITDLGALGILENDIVAKAIDELDKLVSSKTY